MESFIFWAGLLGAPTCAVAAFLAARHAGQSSWLNLATVLLPPILFFTVAVAAGTQDAGLGLALWPIVVALVASYALALKVFAVDRIPGSVARITSLVWLVSLSVGSVVFAMLAPAWFE
jgi:uncharacterized membrane protein YozB (DUF420 family)